MIEDKAEIGLMLFLVVMTLVTIVMIVFEDRGQK